MSLKDKTVIITGAGSGVGLETADALGRQGASLVLIDLDRQRAEAAVARIEKGGSRPRMFIADLSLQAEVRHVASQILSSTARIDVLINNAGAWFNERQFTSDGLERTFALNHIGYFLLTYLLLDRIKSSAPARIISVSSDGHAEATLDFDDLQSQANYSGHDAYCRSKLANILFTRSLARRLEGTGVTANCLHPGRTRTNFLENVIPSTASKAERDAMWKMWEEGGYAPPIEGARTSIYLASSPEVEGLTGK